MARPKAKRPTNPLAIVAMIFGAAGLASGCSPFFLVFTGLGAFCALLAIPFRPRFPVVVAWLLVLAGVGTHIGVRTFGPTPEEREQARRERLAEQDAKRAERETQRAQRAVEDAECQGRAEGYRDLFIEQIESLETSLVESVSAECLGGDLFEATVMVSDVWHVRVKQIRLQDAQTLWEIWAQIASPTDPDKARLRLVDRRGNKVGGSGWLAGSLISVPD